jgi:hypothetical protein
MTDTLPPLPEKLLARIGEYGLARTDGVGDPERLHRWQLLIDGIKEYAADYARAALPAAQPTVNPPEFQEVSWGVDSVMRPCLGMAVSEYAFRQWAKDVGVVLAAPVAAQPAADGVDLPDGAQP